MDTECVVWGYKPGVLPEPYPIRLTGGPIRHCRADSERWEVAGWRTAIYAKGARPDGLALTVANEYGSPSPAFLTAIRT